MSHRCGPAAELAPVTTSEFDYTLPEQLIAQTPRRRGAARLLVVERKAGTVRHARFADLPQFLTCGDTLVLNNSRVTARRLTAVAPNGVTRNALLLRRIGEKQWSCLLPGSRSIRIGGSLRLLETDDPGARSVQAEVSAILPAGERLLQFRSITDAAALERWGTSPLPPYIRRTLSRRQEERYQTVYGTQPGSAAAPTAGLHLTRRMLAELHSIGVGAARVTLHVDIDTFRPVRSELAAEHVMHGEQMVVSQRAALAINATVGRVIAVGTTSVRALETAGAHTGPGTTGRIAPCDVTTRLFITPGYRFQCVDALITNFHQPKSTLLMLVCAFGGRDLVMRAYQEAIRERYRFFSFGDAMLIL
ncbi:MAG: tRNA preQ1(34) S-adenosylmethionine ribosyltransferase-isomerase QueA [Armatimonadetes bacterium]|nr:tRNA preQ1(34) S-adenosylmethionine ribosyltransferase-isomerase QueA [Armatimonadota bacterium]MDE2206785.1 tRNA preQ1(34) S-adenosylmethionine ribosyltransferase-isomerase QueA [Armatimonadota bacterium]